MTYLGAPAAEMLNVSHRVVSVALQFASGIIVALIAFNLMPPAVQNGPLLPVVTAFFVGGALYVVIEYASGQNQAAAAAAGETAQSYGLYIGVLLDLFVDGVVIGVGSTLDLKTGLLLALGMACSTAPLAFVTTSTARRQGVSQGGRRLLSILYIVCILAGAVIGFAVLGALAVSVRLTLMAFASGFLITTVTQGMIPEANREGEPSLAGLLFIAGISLYALMAMVL